MKTVWQQLNPEIIASIERDAVKYPHTANSVKRACEDTYFWSELKIETIRNLVQYSSKTILSISPNGWAWGEGFITTTEND